MLLFGDHRHQSGHPDAVGPHGQPHRLAVLAEDVDRERVGVLAAQLEDVADLYSARTDQWPGAVRGRVAVAHLGRLDRAVGDEVAPGHQADDVFAGLVGAGDPGASSHHARIDEIPNSVVQQCLRADVALLEERVPGEVGVVEHRVFGRVERGAEALVVDLTVPGQTDRQQFPVPARRAGLEQDVLEGVGRGDLPIPTSGRAGAVGPVDQGGDGRCVAGVVDGRFGQAVERLRFGDRDGDGLDVGGVTGLQAAHEGVLADLAFGQKLLGSAAAHRTGHRRDDHITNSHAGEHLLIRLAVGEVHRPKAVVVDVEGVRVLHDELAAAQDAGAWAGLIAVLGLDLEQQHRKVLVGAVLPLHRQGEQLLVGGTQQVVVVATVFEPEDTVPVFRPPVRRLVRSARKQRREEDLLAADRRHLLTDDVFDLAQHPQTQRQPAVQPRSDRPDITGPDQQLVAGNFGVGRVVAQGAEEQLRHAGDHSGQA